MPDPGASFRLLCPLATTGDCATGNHEPVLKSADTSKPNALLVDGQVMSNSFAPVSRAVNGGGNTSKRFVLVTLPCGVRTVMGPEVASGGTLAVILRSRLFFSAFVNVALAPLNETLVAPVKFVPVSVAVAPAEPCAGLNWSPVKPGGGVGYHASVKAPMPSESPPVLRST